MYPLLCSGVLYTALYPANDFFLDILLLRVFLYCFNDFISLCLIFLHHLSFLSSPSSSKQALGPFGRRVVSFDPPFSCTLCPACPITPAPASQLHSHCFRSQVTGSPTCWLPRKEWHHEGNTPGASRRCRPLLNASCKPQPPCRQHTSSKAPRNTDSPKASAVHLAPEGYVPRMY